MGRGRLEAFSDGVLAIIITIMVLELRPPTAPTAPTLAALRVLTPTLAAYVLSFTYVAIDGNNQHHLLHAAKPVSAGTLWANMHLLFWLSLFPFATSWESTAAGGAVPTAVFFGVPLCAGAAYFILPRRIVAP
ncbi:MAG: DUF1211 domain-containing protein [Gemmatimonadaceae bacterium]|nr:DUF1211 domain-containing protein [Gemmatimonadaceae bacterium]